MFFLGTWVYNESTGLDQISGLPIHSSMYKSLKTNLPKEVMAFPDYPFAATVKGNIKDQSFLHHRDVLAYLEKFAVDHKLFPHIRFNTLVKGISHEPGKNPAWNVTVQDMRSGKVKSHLYQAVMVCNGHYSEPSIPDLPGIESFDGLIMHSHDYRTPQAFEGKTVAVLGAAASGSDIGLEIASVAKRLYLCHNNPLIPSKLPENFSQRKGIEAIVGKNCLRLADQSCIEDVEVLLFCTGYHYSFPFLDSKICPRVENRVVWPLYKHMIHIDYPQLCFIGIPIQICPFPQFDLQVRLFVKTLTGDLVLPGKEEMLADTQHEMETKLRAGVAQRHFHKMGAAQWDYNRSLCQIAQLESIPLSVEKLYNDVHEHRRHHLTTYKNQSYQLSLSTGSYERK